NSSRVFVASSTSFSILSEGTSGVCRFAIIVILTGSFFASGFVACPLLGDDGAGVPAPPVVVPPPPEQPAMTATAVSAANHVLTLIFAMFRDLRFQLSFTTHRQYIPEDSVTYIISGLAQPSMERFPPGSNPMIIG